MEQSKFFNKLYEIEGLDVLKNRELSKYTTFRIGGIADYIVEPNNYKQLLSIITLCKENEVPFIVLGNGSNILASDDGYHGVVICMKHQMDKFYIDNDIMTVQSGMSLIQATTLAMYQRLTGFEFAYGIPGTVGGAVCMNAGAYGNDISDILTNIKVLNVDTMSIYNIPKEKMNFSYRHSIVQDENLIVLEATFGLQYGNGQKIYERMHELISKRVAKQPLDFPSAGSTFKRPDGYFAAQLIQEADLKGFSIGGAQVSEKHSGFIINKNYATSKDVQNLINAVQNKVYDKFGVKLEKEVKFLDDLDKKIS